MKGLKKRIKQGESVLGCWLNLGSALTAEIVGQTGFDWVLIDLEHGAGNEKDVLAQSLLLVTAQRLLRKRCTFCTAIDNSCNHCQNTGYLGRFAVHEVLKLDPVIRSAIESEIDSNTLLKLTQEHGMNSLLTQSERHVKNGLTTASEVLSKIGYIS